MKTCTKCEQSKDEAEFYLDPRTRKPMARCKVCQGSATLADRARRLSTSAGRTRESTLIHENRKRKKTAGVLKKHSTAGYVSAWRARHTVEANRQARIYAQLHRNKWFRWAWLQILEHYGHKCMACGSTVGVVRDHVLPVSIGGDNHPMNLQPLCQGCNITKRRVGRSHDYRPDAGEWTKTLGDPPHKQAKAK